MELYKRVKNLICNRNPLFQLDEISYIAYCDYAIQDRYIPELNYKDSNKQIECMNELKENDTVFVDFHLTHDKINTLLTILHQKGIKLNFLYLEEPIPNKQILEFLLGFANNIYALNNIYMHPNLHSLFLGPSPHAIGNLLQEKMIERTKEFLCILAFSPGTEERKRCSDMLENKTFITQPVSHESPTSVPQWECHFCNQVTHPVGEECSIYRESQQLLSEFHTNEFSKRKLPIFRISNRTVFEYTHKSYFTISPSGCGEECHRFWEALYLDSIPIVKRTHTYFDKNFENLPCLIVNEWSDVTEELLEELKESLQEKLRMFNKENPRFFTDLSVAIEYYRKNI